jgi:hypothetical protein
MDKRRDKRAFGVMMLGLSEVYGKEFSPALLEIYWKTLEQYEIDDVERATMLHLGNPDAGAFFPRPADLVRHIQGNTKSRALQAWSKVEKAMRSVGSYASVAFDDPLIHAALSEMGGWVHLCNTDTDELPFRAAEFEKRYIAHLHAGGVAEYPRYFPGITETANAAAGLQHDEAVRLIGNRELAALCFQAGRQLPALPVRAGGVAGAVGEAGAGLAGFSQVAEKLRLSAVAETNKTKSTTPTTPPADEAWWESVRAA